MRFLIIVILALAGLKIFAYQYFYKAGMTEALLAAYQSKALTACAKSGSNSSNAGILRWHQPSAENVQIGDGETDVPFWRMEDPMWPSRFQNPQLVLSSKNGSRDFRCVYDVVAGRASVRPM